MDLKIGKLTVRPGFPLFAAALTVTFGTELMLPTVLAAAVHEAGHILAIIILGGSIRSVAATAGGLEIRYGGDLTMLREAVIALAGPAAGVFFAFWAAHLTRGGEVITLYRAAGASMALSLINLLPVSVLDGGAALRLALSHFLPPDASCRVSLAADMLICGGTFTAGILMLLSNTHNFSLAICAITAWLACCKKRRMGVEFRYC